MRKIGIFGGAFDPVHVGHVILARDVWENVELDKILFLVNYKPPHKEVYAPFEDRFNMVKLAVEGVEYFEASDFEAIENIVPSYTVNVLERLKDKLKDAEFFLILGADQYQALPSWYNYKRLFEMVNFIVLKRPNCSLKAINTEKVIFLDERLIDISSTEIRERIRQGKSIRYLVPEAVSHYIIERGLYLQV
ncbi:MAG: nicotinate (nicotinamide) nucleotide adenylyltransferase [bacterium]|nr:nicotinate (nicotinamide) nucleotide adenylyltransferase [bacterium]